MNQAQTEYHRWLQDSAIDEETKRELRAIADQPQEIEDRFYRELQFGTGGLRGVIGAGSNRINRYTVGKATQGLAQYLLNKYKHRPISAVIAHDSRHMSPEFALETALVLAANGVKAFLFDSLRPTPELSFAVRHLGCTAGVVITASHNPPEYNGYKVYDENGCQLVPRLAEEVIAEIRGIADFSRIKKIAKEEAEKTGLLVWIGQEVDKAFVNAVCAASPLGERIHGLASDVGIIYTPLHGSGNLAVRAALKQNGFTQVTVVKEQELPDPDFSTVKSPNPEETAAFTLAIELAKKTGADIIIGTDPDCDRMGAVVKTKAGEYAILTGNQAGAIMIRYMLEALREHNRLPQNGVVVKTIVTSELGAEIARRAGLPIVDTLTGFKYIGEKITQFEQSKEKQFLFGYEESYGYLGGTYARDKDAVFASLLICEACAYYKAKGQTLHDVLEELYAEYGAYKEKLVSRTLKGKDGVAKITAIMDDFRKQPPTEAGGVKVVEMRDYAGGLDGLPPENVLKFILADKSWFCLRPSGTEPKIKLYFSVNKKTEQESDQALEQLVNEICARIDAH
ncbi:MAG TPA: phospho-sugar mutase [Bacilli bacterium]